MNVAVIMFYDEKIKEYGELTYFINKKYCEKFNLQIIVSNTPIYTNRHPAWERLPLILENIRNFDYLIWIDADAFFYNNIDNIVDVIKKNSEYNFIFSNDKDNKNINTGFFIIKNTAYSIYFITIWAYDEEFYKNNPYPIYWDQGVLMDMYSKNILEIKSNCIIFDYGILQTFDIVSSNKPYVYHLAGKKFITRCKEIKEYINNIDSYI